MKRNEGSTQGNRLMRYSMQDMFDEKMAEINNDLKELEYMLEVNRSDINEVKDYEARITNFRKLLMQNEYMETSIKGVFAVGDIRAGKLKQLVCACSDGAIAGQKVGTDTNYV